MRLAGVRLTGTVKIEVDVPSGLPLIMIKHQKLSQVLLNLMINVADALDENPAVGGGKVRLAATRDGAQVRMVVEDNGPGLPEAVLARLFEPFFTTKSPGKGTGLGLALSREFVQRSGGTLTAENRSEGGARFILKLPTA